MTKIATGETEKNEVVDSTLKLFYDKFQSFRANMQRVYWEKVVVEVAVITGLQALVVIYLSLFRFVININECIFVSE